MLKEILLTAWGMFTHMWYFPVLGIAVAALLDAFVPKPDLKSLFRRAGIAPVLLATAIGAFTPFCSCSTVAIIISLLAAGVPWAPVMAFLVSSPLTDPRAFTMIAGILGIRMAVAQLVASLVMGVGAGAITEWIARRGYLDAQVRGMPADSSLNTKSVRPTIGMKSALLLREIWRQTVLIGRYFLLFIVLAAVIKVTVPNEWILEFFGGQSAYSVPLGALLGVPFYTSTSSTLPLLRSLMEMGMSPGAALAFLIAGPATCLPVIGAVITIAKQRVLWLYLCFILLGAVISGYLFQMM